MPPASNIVPVPSKVPREERERLLGHKGAVIWLTGLSGAGKSTLGFYLEQRLVAERRLAFALDGDNVRHGLCADLGFSPHDRTENIRRVGEVAALLADAGAIVIACFISPFRADRERARQAAGPQRFFEIYLDTPIAVCEARDPKGLYLKARAGQIEDFTGVSSPYEPPLQPDLVLRTQEEDVQASAGHVLALLGARGIVPKT